MYILSIYTHTEIIKYVIVWYFRQQGDMCGAVCVCV